MTRLWLALVLAAQAQAAAYSRQGNVFVLERGAEMEWLTADVFRFRRGLDGAPPPVKREQRAAVQVETFERDAALEFRTRHLRVEIGRRTMRLRVAASDGELLAEDRTDAVRQNGAICWERLARPGTRYYGMGPRTDLRLDAGGLRITAGVPFLLTTAGYAEYHAAPGEYTFDLRRGNRIEIRGGESIDYYFGYGPGPKEIGEELLAAGVSVPEPPVRIGDGSWQGLRGLVASLAHASFSGLMMPQFEFANGPARARAAQVEEYVTHGGRKELEPLFDAYLRESESRGLPLLRPLAMQFSGDAAAADITDEFMLGDELLLAPICTPEDERMVYLPMGIWTRLDTHEVFRGRQTVRVRSEAMPVFSRNGAILPLERQVRELHYFPKLGAEFFFYESEPNEWTQVHAAPAADIMRLEIESKVEREYEWVVHHTDAPRQVGLGEDRFTEAREKPGLEHGKWFYDASLRSVHIRVRVRAGEDRIVNLWF